MSEHIRHEEYVAKVRRDVVATAKAMLSGELNYLEGARRLVALRLDADVTESDEGFRVFVAIDSETDEFPLGRVRKEWSEDALKFLQPEIDKAVVWAREFGDIACEALIRRFDV